MLELGGEIVTEQGRAGDARCVFAALGEAGEGARRVRLGGLAAVADSKLRIGEASAGAIRRLLEEFNYTHEQAAQAIGRSRSATSNLLRLLNLADPVQTMLLAGDIEMGHARSLLSLDRAQQILLAHQVVQRRLSVRETEKLVTNAVSAADRANGFGTSTPSATVTSRRFAGLPDRDVARLRERIADQLGTEVDIVSKPSGKGKLVIHFSNNDSFNGLLGRLQLTAALDEESA